MLISGPAGIAGIDGDVGLDEGQVVAGIALLGTDDAGGHGVLQPERASRWPSPIRPPSAVDVADLDRRQSGCLDLHDGDVGALVGTDDPGLELALVRQGDQTSSAPSTTWALVMTKPSA
jgi:hypothetical protein